MAQSYHAGARPGPVVHPVRIAWSVIRTSGIVRNTQARKCGPPPLAAKPARRVSAVHLCPVKGERIMLWTTFTAAVRRVDVRHDDARDVAGHDADIGVGPRPEPSRDLRLGRNSVLEGLPADQRAFLARLEGQHGPPSADVVECGLLGGLLGSLLGGRCAHRSRSVLRPSPGWPFSGPVKSGPVQAAPNVVRHTVRRNTVRRGNSPIRAPGVSFPGIVTRWAG